MDCQPKKKYKKNLKIMGSFIVKKWKRKLVCLSAKLIINKVVFNYKVFYNFRLIIKYLYNSIKIKKEEIIHNFYLIVNQWHHLKDQIHQKIICHKDNKNRMSLSNNRIIIHKN